MHSGHDYRRERSERACLGQFLDWRTCLHLCVGIVPHGGIINSKHNIKTQEIGSHFLNNLIAKGYFKNISTRMHHHYF